MLSMGSIPEIGGNLTFICSITSTKVPSDYDLSFSYTWFVSGQTNPSHSRYTYIGNKYTISNAQRTDKDKPVTCTATERINGVNLTSDQSNRLTTDVYCKYSIEIGFTLANIQ